MRIAVWPVPPALALADALAGAGSATEVAAVEPFEAASALHSERADLALVPTLDVLRAPEAFELVPGVALAGERDPLTRLVLGSPLDRIRTVAFDPRHAQAALLAQLVLREHYNGRPAFVPAGPDASLDALLDAHDAVLAPADAEIGERTALDLGQEWTDLTLRPMVWGLLAARPGTLDPEAARVLRNAAAAASPEAVRDEGARAYQLTLDGYAHGGLDEFVKYLYYHGTFADLPDLPFLVIPAECVGTANGEAEDDS